MKRQPTWLERNPLRRWRLDQRPPVRRQMLARLLDVARNTLSYWERGFHVPREEQMERITALTGITYYHWCMWLQQRPPIPTVTATATAITTSDRKRILTR